MSEIEVTILGVCCSCQSPGPVYDNPNLTEEELRRMDDRSDPFYNEADYYLMAKHRTNGDTGVWCEGQGTVPQAIVDNQV